MMNSEIITLIANTSGTLGLAIFAIVMLNRVWTDRLDAEKARAEEMSQMRQRNAECVEESAKVIAANTEVLRDNTEVMRQLLYRLRKDRPGEPE